MGVHADGAAEDNGAGGACETSALRIVAIRSGGSPEVVKIGLSDGAVVMARPCYLEGCGAESLAGDLLLGDAAEDRELSPAEEEALRFAAAAYRAETAGTRLIARAEQTTAGLSRKLEQRGYSRAAVAAVVARFVDQGLVENERYAERWLQARLARSGGRGESPRELAAALLKRGISRDEAREAMTRALDSETEGRLLASFVERRLAGPEREGRRLRSRLRFEGFSSSVVDRYLEDADEE